MKKTLYICGDSFCSADPEYGPNWPELLANSCDQIDVINLSSPGASNYLVYLQVQQALEANCNYIIYHATSSIRQEFLINSYTTSIDNIDRYWTPHDKENKSMVSNSWISPHRNAQVFSNNDLQIIKNFFTKFVDMPSLIMKNYIFICHTLDTIKNSKVENWAWSRGGFEHVKFQNSTVWDFSKYSAHEAKINLWDDYDASLWRPYYHITDRNLLDNVCKMYIDMLQLTHDTN
jgi:hypothetical protein